ncbi:LysE family translocator [Actinoplanes regularis]|uniref:LysE family translocator n=1 Tax=Actinoplanes regularis TaxID=52697 RepID=UPI0024A11CAE|nr:LysE family translocator [Actinoplanes regularis]GLW35639.1 lysine transporter LysE [Actinoplanes regularis]
MISLSVLLGYLTAIALLMITPGPDMMFVLTNAGRYGARAGMVAALGVACGEMLHVAAVVAGLAALLVSSPVLFAVIRYAGAAYLVYLGVQALRQRAIALDGDGAPAGNAFLRGLVTNLLNPKMILFSVAFLPQFVRPAAGNVTGQLIVLGALFIAMQLAVDMTLALTAGRFGARLARGRTARWLNRGCAAVFVTLGLRLAWG